MKACNKCGIEKPLDSFHKEKRNRGGYCHECKECSKKRHAENYLKNKEHHYSKALEWRNANKDKVAAYQKKYREEDPERYASYIKKWQQENPDKVREGSHRRRVRKALNPEFKITERDMRRIYYGTCTYCGSSENITADHVIPVSRGGSHGIGNLVSACAKCNFSKHNLFIMEWRIKRR